LVTVFPTILRLSITASNTIRRDANKAHPLEQI
jgi:hypothetical protein